MGKFHTDYALKSAPSDDDYILVSDASTGEVVKIRVADITAAGQHTHQMRDIVGLSAALAGKADANHTHNAADLAVAIQSMGTSEVAEGNLKLPTSDAVYTAIKRKSTTVGEIDTELSSTSENAVQNKAIKSAIDSTNTEIRTKGERVHKLQISSSGKGSSKKLTVSDVVVSPDDGWKIDRARSNALYIVDITSSAYTYDVGALSGYVGPAILEVIRIESNGTLQRLIQQLYDAARYTQGLTLNLQREFDTTNSVWGDWHEERTLNDDTLLRYTGVITVNAQDPENPALWDTSDIDRVYSRTERGYINFVDASSIELILAVDDRFYLQTVKFKNSNDSTLSTTIGHLFWSNSSQILIVFSTSEGDGGSFNSNIKFYHRIIHTLANNQGITKFTEFQPFSSGSSDGQSVNITSATDEDIDAIINSLNGNNSLK